MSDIPSNSQHSDNTETTKPFDGLAFVQSLSNKPGVYLMFDKQTMHLYVGKARDLKKRVSSYFRKSELLPPKTRVMINRIHHMEIIETTTESEALILESNLIKTQKPRYNILLRDNKSYPYIVIDTSHDFPRLDLYRGKKKKGLKYFGPYPHASSVRQTLSLLQKLFMVRLCENSYYSHRTRACLQYQIKRCTAPCVNLVSKESYAEQIKWAEMFLTGKSRDLLDELTNLMQQCSENLDFEKAAQYRDIVNSLRHTITQQNIESGHQDLDVFGFALGVSKLAMCVTFIRVGRVVGDKRFVLEDAQLISPIDAIEQFIMQFYQNKPVPSEVVLPTKESFVELIQNLNSSNQHLNTDDNQHHLANYNLSDIDSELASMCDSLQVSLTEISDKQVYVKLQVRGIREKWQIMAKNSADLHLQQHEETQYLYTNDFRQIQHYFHLDILASQMACIDISHMMGGQTYASYVVFNHHGMSKKEYRSFKIKDITLGDDYAAIMQTVGRVIKNLKKSEKNLPDILFIDGGKGQLNAALKAIEDCKEEFKASDQSLDYFHLLNVIAIAKGKSRKEGKEWFIWQGTKTSSAGNKSSSSLTLNEKNFDTSNQSLFIIQQLRNEAHRFAITKHRKARGKQQVSSILNDIPGIGEKKRQAMIHYFGGLQGITKASIAELEQVEGISQRLAQTIYHFLH